jgi:hypothetical protein
MKDEGRKEGRKEGKEEGKKAEESVRNRTLLA